MALKIGKAPFALAFLPFLACACATGRSGALPLSPVTPEEPSLPSCKLWGRGLEANLSHLSISRSGRRILVSSSADQGRPDGTEARVRMYDGAGRLLWSHWLEEPVKAQAISPDGRYASISTFGDSLFLYNARGRLLWERPHLGRPVILSKAGLVLLLNDDDAEPRTAFLAYDLRGRKKAEVKVGDKRFGEPLDMFLGTGAGGADQVLVTTAGGGLLVYSIEGKLLSQGHVPGEIVTAAMAETSAGEATPAFRIFSLSQPSTLTALIPGRSGMLETKWTVTVDPGFEAIRAAGAAVILYGNSHRGQALRAWDAESGKPMWARSYPNPATFSSLVFSHPGYVSAAFESEDPPGILNVMAVGDSGRSLWQAALESGDGIYSYAVAPSAPAVAAGTGEPGDSILEYYRVGRGCATN